MRFLFLLHLLFNNDDGVAVGISYRDDLDIHFIFVLILNIFMLKECRAQGGGE